MSKDRSKVNLFVNSQQIIEGEEQQEFEIETTAELTETNDAYFLIFEQVECLGKDGGIKRKQALKQCEQMRTGAKKQNMDNTGNVKFSLKIQKDLEKIILRRFDTNSYVLNFINSDLSYNHINTSYGRLELIYRTNEIVELTKNEKQFEISLNYDLIQGGTAFANNSLKIAFSKIKN